jgi:hypothetical protein
VFHAFHILLAFQKLCKFQHVSVFDFSVVLLYLRLDNDLARAIWRWTEKKVLLYLLLFLRGCHDSNLFLISPSAGCTLIFVSEFCHSLAAFASHVTILRLSDKH